MSFPRTDDVLRTDTSFRNKFQSSHHREYSILEELPIDMINDFVVSDPLHLLELGVMRRKMDIWINGSKHFDFKWKKAEIEQLNRMLQFINGEMPTEIHRAVRSIDVIKFWKGLEFRTFLLYVGIVVLKDMLRSEEYEHFLYLFCAVSICSTEAYKDYLGLAENLFIDYIETYIDLYGIANINSNVHNLCHVIKDVQRFGNLNTISTYEFENKARLIKLKLKQCNKPLQQVARRISEQHSIEHVKISKTDPQLKYSCEVSNEIRYGYVRIRENFILSTKKWGDKWFLLTNGDIAEFKYAIIFKKQTKICGKILKDKTNFFQKPFSSSYIHVYLSTGERYEDNFFSITDIKSKMLCFTYKTQFVLLPLLHTLNE